MKFKDKAFKIAFENLVFLEKDFIVKKSSSTNQIKYNGNTEIFSDSRFNFNVMHRYNELKSELEANINFFQNDKETGYFNYGKIVNNEKVFNIDLTSAYLTILYNTKKISKELFQKINGLKKSDRLKVLGMLAYQPFVFYYQKGKLISNEQIKNKFRHIFFYCVKETFELIYKIKNKIGADFVFSWVDGIYFTGEYNINIISDILKSKKLNFTVERLFNFTSVKADELNLYAYDKFNRKKNIFEEKKICVPDSNTYRVNNIIFDFNQAMQKNNEKNLDLIIEQYLKNKY
jgi:hypothetical protein